MKKKFATLCITILVASGFNCIYAQCNTSSVLTSSKTLYLDSTNTVVRTQEENTTIEITKTEIIISPGNDEGRIMKGSFISNDCNWKIPYKEGKIVIKTAMADPNDEPRPVTITLEGKSGVVTLLVTLDNEPNKRIKVIADKFELKKQ